MAILCIYILHHIYGIVWNPEVERNLLGLLGFFPFIHHRYDEKLRKDTESYNKYLSCLETFVEVANSASTVKIVHQHEI